jgi:hypothetical protein
MFKPGRAFWVAALVLLGTGNAIAVEEAEYTVVLKEGRFEVREYEPCIVAETIVDGDFEDAGDEAFGRLFKYISGNNKSRQEINMTAPVEQAAASQKINMTAPVGQVQVDGEWAVSFMMPASFTLETVPEPKDPSVILRQVPARNMAAVEYSGFWSEKGYLRNKARLKAWIDEKGFKTVGEPVWARYNPPFMPWFLRRNEVLLPIDSLPHNE